MGFSHPCVPISFWGLCFILEMEFDLDKALEEVLIHIEDPPFPSGRQEKRSSGFISELPSEEGKKLEHFTKLRPKRNKKQQPTQAAVGGLGAPPAGGLQRCPSTLHRAGSQPRERGGPSSGLVKPNISVWCPRSFEKTVLSSFQLSRAEAPLEDALRKIAVTW